MRRLAVFMAMGIACHAAAAPKVDDDGLPDPGEHKVEAQLDKSLRSARAAPEAARPLNVVAEYAYGLRERWQIAFKAMLAFQGGRSRGDALAAEVRYVAPHDEEKGGYWGVNLGLQYQTPRDEDRKWEAELVPVLGYRLGRWHAIANLGLSHALNGEGRKLMFAMATKLAYQVNDRHAAGLEYFHDAGPLSNWNPREERSEYLFLAWDGALKKADFNFGIGRGLTDASNRWVLKLIFAFPL